MAQNYISRGEVITLTAKTNHTSGTPYRINGFNGVALISIEAGDLLSFQLEGIFEFELAGVSVGDRIFIDEENVLHSVACEGPIPVGQMWNLFGRAVTATDGNGKFLCRLLQS